jgi:hypothetical protein
MKRATGQKFPAGLNEKKVQAVIAHYDRQSEEEGAAEIETAPAAPGETWMSVPSDLVATITRLIEDHQQKASLTRSTASPTKGRRDSKSNGKPAKR